jgi:hypothetical protein
MEILHALMQAKTVQLKVECSGGIEQKWRYDGNRRIANLAKEGRYALENAILVSIDHKYEINVSTLDAMLRYRNRFHASLALEIGRKVCRNSTRCTALVWELGECIT